MQINGRPELRFELHAKVHSVLARSPYFLGRKLRVELQEDDAVVLSGVLGSFYEKQMAQESILAIAGVQRVRNEIEVIGS